MLIWAPSLKNLGAHSKNYFKLGTYAPVKVEPDCPNGQADFLNTIQYTFLLKWMAQIPRNMQTMQQNWEENGIQIHDKQYMPF